MLLMTLIVSFRRRNPISPYWISSVPFELCYFGLVGFTVMVFCLGDLFCDSFPTIAVIMPVAVMDVSTLIVMFPRLGPET